MDEFFDDTNHLLSDLNEWNLDDLLSFLTTQAYTPERILSVVEEYFRRTDLGVPVEILDKEVDLITQIFPEYSRDYLLNLFEALSGEERRLRVVIKILINEKRNEGRKRCIDTVQSDEVPVKRLKTDNDYDSTDNVPQTSLESNSTIIYLPQQDLCEDAVQEIENTVSTDFYLDQPSTSKSGAYIEQIPTESSESYTEQIPTESSDAYVEQNPAESSYIEKFSNEDTACEIVTSNVENDLPDSSTEGTTQKNDYNLYKHLQGIFTTMCPKLIRKVCKMYNVNKYIPPSDNVLNDIVTKLLVLQSTDESKAVSKKLDIVVESINTLGSQLRSTTGSNSNEEPLLIEDDMPIETEILDDPVGTEENSLIYPLMEMFPEACPQFIRKICMGKKSNNGVLDELISDILETDYPKRLKLSSPPRPLDPSEQLEMMKSILVDADPDYLQMHCHRLIDKPEELKEFVAKAIEKRDYPTMKDFLRKQQISAQQKQYTTDFSIEKFLEVIPNPFEYFSDPNRKVNHLDYQSYHYALCYLRNKFDTLSLRTIRDTFSKTQNFLKTCCELSKVPSSLRMRSKRAKCSMPEVITNIPLLQEVAFFEHQSKLLEYTTEKILQDAVERAQTKIAGLMKTCTCCFDDEIMPKDVFTCEMGCVFCKSCVQKGVEVAFGDGKLDFYCLSDCSSQFSLQVLQAVLTPKMFSAIALKKQVQEVKAAGIEDLETCPFCDFVTIPARDDKLFRCLNPECMKESCRQCKEPSHVPLRCDEVEKDNDVKARTYIENKMTEALLRTCYKCGMKFIKEDGCNKMTCSCGALMCYVCGKPVKDYKHFNGQGGDKVNLCPLYSDTNKLHRDAVLKGAQEAKNEIGVTDSELKINPTEDIQKHYKVKQSAKPNIPPLVPFDQLTQEEVLLQQRALHLFEQHWGLRGRTRRGHHHHHHRHPH